MSDITDATMVTYTTAGRTELPATIDGIRAALPADERDQFDTEVGKARASDLPRLLAHWALRTDPQAMDDMEATFARLAAGDLTGCVPQEPEAGAA